MVETSLLMGGNHPRLLVLDAARRFELGAQIDLRSFIEYFYRLSKDREQPIQLIFSATDPEVVPEPSIDMLWKPTFETDGETHFLGAPKEHRGTCGS